MDLQLEAGAPVEKPDAESCRVKGNELFKAGDFLAALKHYDEGVRLLTTAARDTDAMVANVAAEGVETGHEGQEAVLELQGDTAGQKLLAALHCNRAASLFREGRKLESRKQALPLMRQCVAACDTALALDPAYAKVHLRRGQALYEQGQIEGSILAVKEVSPCALQLCQHIKGGMCMCVVCICLYVYMLTSVFFYMCICYMCMCMCMCVYEFACVCACVCVCVYAWASYCWVRF